MSARPLDARGLLAACPLFNTLEAETRGRLADAARFRVLAPREVLFSRGDPSDGLYIIASGLIRIWITDADGNEFTLSLPEIGDVLGEMGLIDGSDRSAHATALDRSSVLFIGKAEFMQILDEDIRLSRHLVTLLAERLRNANARLHGLAFESLRQRLAATLVDLAQAHGKNADGVPLLSKKISQTALAQMLGVSREAVNKQLRALTLDGMIEQRSEGLIVLEADKLQTIATQE